MVFRLPFICTSQCDIEGCLLRTRQLRDYAYLMLIRTFETSIPRNSESFHVFPTENEPFVLSFDL